MRSRDDGAREVRMRRRRHSSGWVEGCVSRASDYPARRSGAVAEGRSPGGLG